MPYYRKNLYVLSLSIFLAALSWNQVVPFLPRFLESMGVKEGLLNWVGIVFAAQAGASLIAQPFWGKLGDSHGRRLMVIRAGVCLSAIYFGMSMCNAPWQLALLRFLNGALTGFMPGAFALIATNTPEQIAPRSVATAQTFSAAGLILGPAVGGLLAAQFGYRMSMQISGLTVLVATLLVWLLVSEPNRTVAAVKTSLMQDFGISLRSPVMSSLMFVSFVSWSFGSAVGPMIALYLPTLGSSVTDRTLGIIYALPSAAFVLLARRWTTLGEERGFDRTIVTGFIGSALGMAMIGLAPGVWSFGVVYFLSGVFLAAIGPSTGAITCTMVDSTFRGRAYGMQQAAGTLGGLVAPLAATQIGRYLGMKSVFIAVAMLFLAGAVVFRSMVTRWEQHATGLDKPAAEPADTAS